jgi:hypothetical protein
LIDEERDENRGKTGPQGQFLEFEVSEKLGVIFLQLVIDQGQKVFQLRGVRLEDHSPISLKQQREQAPESLVLFLDLHQ